MADQTLTLTLRGELKGHGNWVTSLATPVASKDSNLLVSGSRDKTLIVWNLTREDETYGVPKQRLYGHNHFVEDVQLSSDGLFAISASCDKTLRLWDLRTGTTSVTFSGHEGDVTSVTFSSDNRQIVSGSRDKTIKLWNIRGECKFTITEDQHTEWVSCVRFSPSTTTSRIVSCGHDNTVKVWDLAYCKLLHTLHGHTGYVNSVTVSPDGSLCASGGKDGMVMLWDVKDGKHLYRLDPPDNPEVISALCFSPNRYWLVTATQECVRVWNLETKSIIIELRPQFPPMSSKALVPHCISLCWSADGNTLFTGYTDNVIRVWAVTR